MKPLSTIPYEAIIPVLKFDKVLKINKDHIEAEISRKRILDKMGKNRLG